MPNTASERLDDDDIGPRRPEESPDDYVRRGIRESSGGRRYIANLESGDRRYAADSSYKGTKYSSDSSLKGTKYGADKGYEGTVYRADSDLAGTKYRADVDERGNRMSAGNQFMGTYAKLLETPANYFAAQNMLANGQAAGYTPFVQEAYGTVRPGGTFRPYVGAFPGNAAQALFHQGGDDRPYYNRPEKEKRRAERRWYISGFDDRFKRAYGVDDIGKRALKDWRQESGRDAPDWQDATDRANFDKYVEDWRGVHVPRMTSSAAMRPTTRPAPVFRPYVEPAEAEARRRRERAEAKLPMGLFGARPTTDDIVWDGNGDGSWDRHGGYAQGGEPEPMPSSNGPDTDAWIRRNRWWVFDGQDQRRPAADPLIIEDVDWQPHLLDEPPANGLGSERGRYITPGRGAHRPYTQGGNQMTEDGGDSTVDPTPYQGFGQRWYRKVKNPTTGAIEEILLDDTGERPYQGFGQRWWQKVRNTQTGDYEDVPLPDPDPTPYPGFGQRLWRKVRNPVTGDIEEVEVPEGESRNDLNPAEARPYAQGGESANWMTDDSWATPEDKQRLAEMDQAFKPGVHRWKAGYWAGLDDDAKDLWRSYFGYRGLSPKAVEARIDASQPYNSQYLGAGRLA